MPAERGRKRRAVILRDGEKCAHCGVTEALTLDHIVPRSKGGSNAIANLRLLCFPCNNRKGNRLGRTKGQIRSKLASGLHRSKSGPDAPARPPMRRYLLHQHLPGLSRKGRVRMSDRGPHTTPSARAMQSRLVVRCQEHPTYRGLEKPGRTCPDCAAVHRLRGATTKLAAGENTYYTPRVGSA